jgi:isopentenyl-diphosphate delta-isomerase type 1
LIVLVDERGNPIGEAEKSSSHHDQTPLHLAFSCYVFDGAGRLLVTRRAGSKKVWPGVWTNSVCGHPQPGESMEAAIRRRLDYELGMSAGDIEVLLPAYRYRAPAFNGVVENEFCPVHFARAVSEPVPNPEEVEGIRWVRWPEFVAATENDAEGAYSWWCRDQVKQLKSHPLIAELTEEIRRGAHRFEPMYQTTPPWDIGRPQPAFARLAEAGRLCGPVLDVGCGTGEHAMLAAKLGLEAAGIDAAPTAIDLARRKASERGLNVRFVLGDALELAGLGATFETVLDCGLFHVFTDEDRVRFVDSVSAVVPPGGRYFLLCFSEHQPGELGPRRVTRDEIRSSFAPRWQAESIEACAIELLDGAAARGWLAELVRSA